MRAHKWAQALAVAALVSVAIIGGPSAKAQDDPALEQVVSEDETIAPAGETTIITDGHIDLGPLMTDGEVNFLARDDRGDHPVWRHLDDITFVVSDAAKQTLPPDAAYDFTGAKGGQEVWAVPQTQVAQVPWLGWSTQSPPITKAVDRGINLEYGGHQGPGQFTLFVQAGNFGQPQTLWTSAKQQPQAVWVDLKTHTHANWVFTEAGIHLVKVHLKAKLLDGTEVDVPKILRFAVGQVDPATAAGQQWDSVNEVASGQVGSTTDTNTPGEHSGKGVGSQSAGISTLTLATIAVVGAGALMLLLGLAAFLRSQKAARVAAAKHPDNAVPDDGDTLSDETSSTTPHQEP